VFDSQQIVEGNKYLLRGWEGKRGRLRIRISSGSDQKVPFEIRKQYFAIQFKIAYTYAVTVALTYCELLSAICKIRRFMCG
jgi:hypothetical protein